MTEPPDVMADRSSRAAYAIAAVGLIALAVVLSLKRLGDLDLGWHLATGKIIAQQHAIPKIDDLAFTHQPLKSVEVLSDLLFYALMRTFGPIGLQLLGAAACSATACLIFAEARPAGAIAFPIVTLAVVTMGSWLSVRPATLSFVFLALTLLLLDTHRRAPAHRRGRLALAAIVPLQVVWANVHGFAPMGAALTLAYFGHRLLARLLAGPLASSPLRRLAAIAPIEDASDVGVAGISALFAIAATTLNSAGPRLLFGPARFDEDMTGITEWEPPTLHFLFVEQPTLLVMLTLAIAAMIFGAELPSDDASIASSRVEDGRRAPRAFDLLLVGLACLLAARAVRFTPVAAILVAPPTARRLHALSARLRPSVAALATWIAPAVVAIRLGDNMGVGFTDEMPEGAARFIESTHPVGAMWNMMQLGGYLAYRLHPNYRVFMDGRNALARDRSRVVAARKSTVFRGTFDALVAEFDMQWAVTTADSGSPFGAPVADESRWAMVFLDDAAAVYVRRDGPNAGLADRGYRVLRHNAREASFLSLAISVANSGGDAAIDVAHDGALAVSQAPDSARSTFYAACGALAVRDFGAVALEVARLKVLAPGNAAIDAIEKAVARVRAAATPAY